MNHTNKTPSSAKKSLLLLGLIITTLVNSGCSYIIEKQTNKLSQRLSDTLLNYEDPQTVSSAMPTFLIIIESIAGTDDASASSQLSAAQIYGAYAGAFVSDPQRQKFFSNKAIEYAEKGSCQQHSQWCTLRDMSSDDFQHFMTTLDKKDAEIAYAYAVAWLGYIQANSDNWSVIADLAKAEALLKFVEIHNESYDNGGVHLYLGAIATTLPPALGGKPDVGRAHFERAIEITQGRHLLVKVEFARRYARLLFNQDLHHQLLSEVLAAETKEPGLSLMNAWSKEQAQILLDEEAEYFE